MIITAIRWRVEAQGEPAAFKLSAGTGKFRLEVPVERFPAPPPEPMRIRDLWTGAFHRPARALQDRIVVDLDGSIVPGIPIHLLEIVS